MCANFKVVFALKIYNSKSLSRLQATKLSCNEMTIMIYMIYVYMIHILDIPCCFNEYVYSTHILFYHDIFCIQCCFSLYILFYHDILGTHVLFLDILGIPSFFQVILGIPGCVSWYIRYFMLFLDNSMYIYWVFHVVISYSWYIGCFMLFFKIYIYFFMI